MLPTVGSVESCIVRLPGTSTSCAWARKSGAKVRRTPENKSIPSLQVLIPIVDSLPGLVPRHRGYEQFMPLLRRKKPFVRACGYPPSPRSPKSFHPAPSEPVPPLPSQHRAGGQHWVSKKVDRRGSLREGSISDPASKCARSPLREGREALSNQRLAGRIADARNAARAV